MAFTIQAYFFLIKDHQVFVEGSSGFLCQTGACLCLEAGSQAFPGLRAGSWAFLCLREGSWAFLYLRVGSWAFLCLMEGSRAFLCLEGAYLVLKDNVAFLFLTGNGAFLVLQVAYLYLKDDVVSLILKDSWALIGGLMVFCLKVSICAVQVHSKAFIVRDYKVSLDDEDLKDGVFLTKLRVFVKDDMVFPYVMAFIILEVGYQGYFPYLAQMSRKYLFNLGFWNFFHSDTGPPYLASTVFVSLGLSPKGILCKGFPSELQISMKRTIQANVNSELQSGPMREPYQ